MFYLFYSAIYLSFLKIHSGILFMFFNSIGHSYNFFFEVFEISPTLLSVIVCYCGLVEFWKSHVDFCASEVR